MAAECVTLMCSLTLCFPRRVHRGREEGTKRERERKESVGQRAKFSKGKLRTGPPSTQPLQRGKIPSLRAWMMNVGTFQVPLAALSLSLFLPPPFRVAVLCWLSNTSPAGGESQFDWSSPIQRSRLGAERKEPERLTREVWPSPYELFAESRIEQTIERIWKMENRIFFLKLEDCTDRFLADSSFERSLLY